MTRRWRKRKPTRNYRPTSTPRLADIYDAPGDPGLRDYFGVTDAAVDAHVGLTGVMSEPGAVLVALMGEFERRVCEAHARWLRFA